MQRGFFLSLYLVRLLHPCQAVEFVIFQPPRHRAHFGISLVVRIKGERHDLPPEFQRIGPFFQMQPLYHDRPIAAVARVIAEETRAVRRAIEE